MVLSVASLVISVFALVISSMLAKRQLASSKNANSLAIIIDEFRDTRGDDYLRAVEYVLYHLAAEHPQPIPYLELPEEAKKHVQRVGLFFNDLGKLVAHGLVDEDMIIGAYGTSVLKAWRILAPYVYLERQANKRQGMAYWEDLAARVASKSPSQVYREIGLRSLPPASS